MPRLIRPRLLSCGRPISPIVNRTDQHNKIVQYAKEANWLFLECLVYERLALIAGGESAFLFSVEFLERDGICHLLAI